MTVHVSEVHVIFYNWILQAWEKWRTQITKLDCSSFWIQCDNHQTREGLKGMLQIMLGNVDNICMATCHWIELYVSHFLYIRPFTIVSLIYVSNSVLMFVRSQHIHARGCVSYLLLVSFNQMGLCIICLPRLQSGHGKHVQLGIEMHPIETSIQHSQVGRTSDCNS